MHPKGICSPTQREDDQVEGVVLSLVLIEHPTPLTFGDLVMELDHHSEDAIGNAVRRLVAVGLLRREGDSVLPTRAALRFNHLETA